MTTDRGAVTKGTFAAETVRSFSGGVSATPSPQSGRLSVAFRGF